MVNLLFAPDDETAHQPGKSSTFSTRPAGQAACCRVPRNTSRAINPNATVALFGQEVNAESYAICRSDMLSRARTRPASCSANSFTKDGHRGPASSTTCSPIRPSAWNGRKSRTRSEGARAPGDAGRFGAGLPRINDGSFLFLQHMISKMKPVRRRRHAGWPSSSTARRCSPAAPDRASPRSAAGSSRTTGWKPSSALPDQLFYNTGISTYFWIVTNRKTSARKGKVVLLDARDYWAKMRKSLGDKRKLITSEQITQITSSTRKHLQPPPTRSILATQR